MCMADVIRSIIIINVFSLSSMSKVYIFFQSNERLNNPIEHETNILELFIIIIKNYV